MHEGYESIESVIMDVIIKSTKDVKGVVRVVFATMVIGMWVHFPSLGFEHYQVEVI